MADSPINFDSEWNMASSYFYRCHVLLYESNQYGSMGDFQSQYLSLFNLHKELSGQMKPDELEHTEELESQARIAVSSKNIMQQVKRKILYDYEIYMRQIMKLRKMDLPRSKDPSKAIIDG
jgi:hypothetical protein